MLIGDAVRHGFDFGLEFFLLSAQVAFVGWFVFDLGVLLHFPLFDCTKQLRVPFSSTHVVVLVLGAALVYAGVHRAEQHLTQNVLTKFFGHFIGREINR